MSSPQDLEKIVDECIKNSNILHKEKYSKLKELIETYGGKIPAKKATEIVYIDGKKRKELSRNFSRTLKAKTDPFKLIFGKSVDYVPHHYLQSCLSLVEVVFEGEIETIGFKAFEKCFSLARVEFKGKCVKHISNSSFYDCTSLGPSIVLPNVERRFSVCLRRKQTSHFSIHRCGRTCV